MAVDGATTLFAGPRNETIDLSIDSQWLAWAALAIFFSAAKLSQPVLRERMIFPDFCFGSPLD
jgi:hypothetical protein